MIPSPAASIAPLVGSGIAATCTVSNVGSRNIDAWPGSQKVSLPGTTIIVGLANALTSDLTDKVNGRVSTRREPSENDSGPCRLATLSSGKLLMLLPTCVDQRMAAVFAAWVARGNPRPD